MGSLYPIIFSSPHAQSSIDDPKLRQRFRLSDYEIWKCSDPFTNTLKHFTCARFKHIAKTHRLVCDFNRAPTVKDAFHDRDFFGRRIFRPRESFSDAEKKNFLEQYWWLYHNNILASIRKLDAEGHKKILIIDYHNTSGDHPLNDHHDYMPSFVISNLGAALTGRKDMRHPILSIPMKYLEIFRSEVSRRLRIDVEIDDVFYGGYEVYWFVHLRDQLKLCAKIYALQIEYNLDLIFNPLSKRVDRKALDMMQNALNKAIVKMYEEIRS